MALNITWGNNLEKLAGDLFGKLYANRSSVDAIFEKRDCIVVPNRTQQAWLQQYFLFDRERDAVPNVLADCDFPLLNLFVNDWLYRMDHPGGGTPDPEQHPFSVKGMRWRIYRILRRPDLAPVFAPIERYITTADGRERDPRKCFKLAGRLAALMNQYTSYRPQMLLDWENGKNTAAEGNNSLAWEPELWRMLTDGRRDETYLAAYRRMQRDLAKCGIENTYRRVFVFAPSMLPPVHLTFFHHLAKILPVDFYLFNPSETDWFDRASLKSKIRQDAFHELPDDPGELLDLKHPLLDAYARGSRDSAAAALDLSGGQLNDIFSAPAGSSLLAKLQQSIAACDASPDAANTRPDESIQLHLCHGKMREVEILRDQLLDCFNTIEGLQPRHIQVQTPDLNVYAPYIEAVFSAVNPNGPRTIPFIIADRVSAGESQASNAFRTLLNLADSRFTAPELLELLRYPAVAKQFGLEADEVDDAAVWLNRAGVRWGRDSAHREHVSHATFGEETTWGYGLDRLFVGYAMGTGFAGDAPKLPVVPCDAVEGGEAVRLAYLAHFYDKLTGFANFSQGRHSVSNWVEQLSALVDDFFLSDNETYRDIAILKSAIRLLATSARAADSGEEELPLPVIREFLIGHLGDLTGGTDLNRNAVIFTSLRPGSSTPRPVQALLGMGDGLFPRPEKRPAYDLLRDARKMGDRSLAIEDRQAFLEALLNARARLLILYPAFSEEDNTSMPESVAVRELLEYLKHHFQTEVSRFTHRLAPYHPAYFDGKSGLFSYSESNCNTAKALAASSAPTPPPPAANTPAPTINVEINELIRFFDNPAKYYFQKVLGAEPRPLLDDLPEDAEVFDPGHLDEWKIRQRIIDAIIAGDPDAARAQIAADNLLPLAHWGEHWFETFKAEVDQLLEQPVPHFATLKDALVADANAPLQNLNAGIPVGKTTVLLSGSIPLINGPVIFDFHASNFKYRRLFATWLKHLFARAADESASSINIQLDKSKPKCTTLESPLAQESAVRLLADYLHIFLFEYAPVPPFVPELSFKYIKTLSGEKSDTAAKAAHDTWAPFNSGHDTNRDPHFAAIFGKSGPFKDLKAFDEWAKRIGQPLLDYLEGGEASE